MILNIIAIAILVYGIILLILNMLAHICTTLAEIHLFEYDVYYTELMEGTTRLKSTLEMAEKRTEKTKLNLQRATALNRITSKMLFDLI